MRYQTIKHISFRLLLSEAYIFPVGKIGSIVRHITQKLIKSCYYLEQEQINKQYFNMASVSM